MRALYGVQRRAAPALMLSLALALTASPARADVGPDPDPWLGSDKALHFSLSAGIAGTTYLASMFVTDDLRVRLALGAGIALLAGTAKELADLAGILGHPSWKDFAWDVAGTLVGTLTGFVLDQLLFTPLASSIPVW